LINSASFEHYGVLFTTTTDSQINNTESYQIKATLQSTVTPGPESYKELYIKTFNNDEIKVSEKIVIDVAPALANDQYAFKNDGDDSWQKDTITGTSMVREIRTTGVKLVLNSNYSESTYQMRIVCHNLKQLDFSPLKNLDFNLGSLIVESNSLKTFDLKSLTNLINEGDSFTFAFTDVNSAENIYLPNYDVEVGGFLSISSSSTNGKWHHSAFYKLTPTSLFVPTS
jgi:hypothetical protein